MHIQKHGWTGRYELHMWDNSCNKEGQSGKARQAGELKSNDESLGKAVDSQEGLQCTEELQDVINIENG
ncbi:hypothetical protein D8674_003002 [Pyrus ussuriensis x Pyrus communis]|uniref:Uncharacterized protein n=1 Tax=Pyrus ussuriensis x Pyrus communis TaxID=2448454 RepID=A0A5N5FGB5_9ROSA|nr:hypothetical protein D8674_003002 [Pyrus ussuriensis x Pyrus communis]